MDVAPKQKTTPRQRVAQLVRLFSTTERGERVSAWGRLVSTMNSENISWSDVGNWIEQGDDGKFTEAEMVEFAQAARAEGVKVGIELGLVARQQWRRQRSAHAAEARRDGRVLSPASRATQGRQAARFHQRHAQGHALRRLTLSRPQLGYLVSIYIQVGGRI